MDSDTLFMAKSGWYHGASLASVPGRRDGGFLCFYRLLKTAASSEKAEVKAKVEAKMKEVRSSLNLDLNLPQKLGPRGTSVLSSLNRREVDT